MQTPPLDADAVLWTDSPGQRPLIVLLHGYGSDENDLFALTDHLPEEFVYAAVRAPLTPPFPMSGNSWYPIDDLSSRDPAAITAGAERLLEWLDAAAPNATSVGLLGFSQGGATALQAMRLAPERFEFIVTLSGYAADGSLPGDDALKAHPLPVFWGRGALDNVIPAPAVARTTEWLPEHSALVGRIYPGLAHAVSAAELDDIRAFLRAQLPA
ncbi:alpha/beta hydrolase [Microbacterium amylolyticum]|uniref:Phospholipase/carboxylesterase n=1 Tax=Microbacterium amylolyticum TaxID=936337 RepID=A0ABS4ZHL6_9MICO|nr:alpha/beta hydrolase-fold protein [Microbacterium amylolyticum]MBP2436548.1 phospholipase/carboxylesterase [Microbacterium amylolyticum]